MLYVVSTKTLANILFIRFPFGSSKRPIFARPPRFLYSRMRSVSSPFESVPVAFGLCPFAFNYFDFLSRFAYAPRVVSRRLSMRVDLEGAIFTLRTFVGGLQVRKSVSRSCETRFCPSSNYIISSIYPACGMVFMGFVSTHRRHLRVGVMTGGDDRHRKNRATRRFD